jgi:hypothetical protein
MELSRNMYSENAAHESIEAPLKLLSQFQPLGKTIAVVTAQYRRSGSRTIKQTNRLELVAVKPIPVFEETDSEDIETWFWNPV